jgi:CubicO group peptidase (beta-lactamase class C family)
VKVIRKIALIILAIVYLINSNWLQVYSSSETGKDNKVSISKEKFEQIDRLVKQQMRSSKIPGMAVVVVSGSTDVIKKGYGFADVAGNKPVTTDTMFELGSNSKSFTGLGILDLEEKGLITLSDSVDKYIPWFNVVYKGKEVKITLNDLLHHNSGLPIKTIGYIKEESSDSALENAVRTLIGQELNFVPGRKYQYATINYDVLGLIIQKVTGKAYETYLKNNILEPLGLKNTVLFRDEAVKKGMARGYKYGLMNTFSYNAPVFRGNTPAGYVTTNANDIAKWLKLQIGTTDTSDYFRGLINRSHIPNRSVAPGPILSSYAVGWHSLQSGSGEYTHSGANPDYYSVVTFRPEEKVGVAVLANIYSYGVQNVADRVMDILMDRELRNPITDTNNDIDKVFTAILFMLVPFIAVVLINIIIFMVQLIRRERRFKGINVKSIYKIIISLLFMAGFAICVYLLPQVIPSFRDLRWDYIYVWGPFSTIPAVLSILIAGILTYIYMIMANYFPKPSSKQFFSLIALGVASGFGNAFVIFVVNTAVAEYTSFNLNSNDYKFPVYTFIYFIAGLILYVMGQRLIRTRLVRMVNDHVCNMRQDLINKILMTSFDKLEKIEKGKIQACLNNDTETISKFSGIVVSGITSIITMTFCLYTLGL